MTDLDAAEWALPDRVRVRLATESDSVDGALVADERGRVTGFKSPARQRQFALGRLAVRSLVGDVLGVRALDVPLRVAEDGAPEVPGLVVSIAHTGREGSVSAVAAVGARSLGVDLERIAPRRHDLSRRILRPDEREVLDALGGPTDETQTLLWALKEAVLKAQRTGLRAGARSVRLELYADGAPPDRGAAAAVSGAGAWTLTYGRLGDLWLAVAYEKQTR